MVYDRTTSTYSTNKYDRTAAAIDFNTGRYTISYYIYIVYIVPMVYLVLLVLIKYLLLAYLPAVTGLLGLLGLLLGGFHIGRSQQGSRDPTWGTMGSYVSTKVFFNYPPLDRFVKKSSGGAHLLRLRDYNTLILIIIVIMIMMSITEDDRGLAS